MGFSKVDFVLCSGCFKHWFRAQILHNSVSTAYWDGLENPEEIMSHSMLGLVEG